MTGEFILQMEGISKFFPGVRALDDVTLNVRPGTVHALLGENGAGKSTLMKILIGMYHPDGGTITFQGKRTHVADTRSALGMGISMIHQELSQVPEMTVAENLYLGREPRNRFGLVDRRAMNRQAADLFARWNIPLVPTVPMKSLSVAAMQMAEIAKAISYDARVVIMDEPTSAITDREVELLFEMIHQLRDAGTAILYITHKMDEVFQISDEVTVFRDGRLVATHPASEMDSAKLIRLMVGRELTHLFPKEPAEIGEVVLSVRGLRRGKLVDDVSFDLRRGEILGLAGLMGAGRTEVLETIFGIERAEAGQIVVNGRPVRIRGPRDAIRSGIGLLTEDRKRTGVMGPLSVRDNMFSAALPRFTRWGFLLGGRMNQAGESQRRALAIKTPTLRQIIENLSGGNQQKVLISRWLLTLPDILMIDEPTRGIDVGAKSEIHRLMSTLVGQGKAIVMVSSEMPEVLGMSDRIVVMHEGRVAGELSHAEATQDRVMELATGTVVAA